MRRRLAAAPDSARGDDGFTLVELIIVIAVLPIVVGAIAVSLISVFSLQHTVSQRVSDSNDALVASASFNRDVQSAEQMTTQSSLAACGSLGSGQTQLLALAWGSNTLPQSAGGPAGGYDNVVSYISTKDVNPQTNAATYSLTRQVCSFGTSASPASTRTLAHDIGSSPTVTIYGPKNAQGNFTDITDDFATWTPTLSVTKVQFDVQGSQTASGFTYSLVGLPGESKSQSSASTLTNPNATPGCGFATSNPQSTYANLLCFADFTGYSYSAASTGTCRPPNGLPAQTGQLFELPVANTPYTLSFCLKVSANVVAPSVLPTYYDPSGDNSEAFLGNNGFYTGVPGSPALYMDVSGQYVTMTFSAVQVLDAAGQPATGWTLVTGDAESTDTSEWIAFSNTTGGLNWSILPNNGSSDLWGNACYDDKDANNNGALAWTGPVPATTTAVGDPGSGPPASGNATTLNVDPTTFATGVPSVLCESDQQLNKTGTLMLQGQEPAGTSAPQSMVISTKGAGLQAIFVGVLL